MRIISGFLSVLVFATLSCFAVGLENDGAPAKPVKVLAIGNSFSRNATEYLPALAEAAGRKLVLGKAELGGCSLERHADNARAFVEHPESKKALSYKGRSLQQVLESDEWDYVTIQQVSTQSYKTESFYPAADEIVALIREKAPGAEILVHQTWAYREDSKYYKPERTPSNEDEMFKGISEAYGALAKKYDLRIIPSGAAMQAAREDAEWGPFIDPVSKEERPGRSLHSRDAKHAGLNGKYLQACVWLEFLFGGSAVGNTFIPEGMSATEAGVLQRIATETVGGL
jgi:hypothetical protein